jgi:hypothetical protein
MWDAETFQIKLWNRLLIQSLAVELMNKADPGTNKRTDFKCQQKAGSELYKENPTSKLEIISEVQYPRSRQGG